MAGNLLMVSNYPSDTGYAWWLMEHFWKTLAVQFCKVGYEAYLAFPRLTVLSPTMQSAPIVPTELRLPWHTIKQATSVRRFIREKEIKVIYFTDQLYCRIQYFLLRLDGVKYIIIHDHTPGDRPPVSGVKGSLKALRNMLPLITADLILCVSDLMRQRDIRNLRIPASRCAVVQNGIPLINCDRVKALELKASIGIRQDALVVVTTGRVHPYKRFDFIIDSANELRKAASNLQVVFLIVGDGPAFPQLQEQVQRLGLVEWVRLLGFKENIREFLCLSDMAFHASLGEGFSLSILEYMSAGLPVIVPDIPSVRQAIRDTETGMVYPWDDAYAAAQKIIELATDPVRRMKMGKLAKQDVDANYNIDRCTMEFLAAIGSICPIDT